MTEISYFGILRYLEQNEFSYFVILRYLDLKEISYFASFPYLSFRSQSRYRIFSNIRRVFYFFLAVSNSSSIRILPNSSSIRGRLILMRHTNYTRLVFILQDQNFLHLGTLATTLAKYYYIRNIICYYFLLLLDLIWLWVSASSLVLLLACYYKVSSNIRGRLIISRHQWYTRLINESPYNRRSSYVRENTVVLVASHCWVLM